VVILSNQFGVSTFKNAPGTRRTGLELSSQNKVAPHWAANAAVSWIDAIYSQSFTSGTTAVANGNKLPGIPQHTLFAELVWTSQNTIQALSPARKKPMGSQAALELISAGRLFANDANTASSDGYTTLNLRASQAWPVGPGRLTAFGRIDNLTDQRYVGSVIVNQASFQFYEPAPGINWTLGLRLSVPW
jgi:iron complex outermembrane receptor protein